MSEEASGGFFVSKKSLFQFKRLEEFLAGKVSRAETALQLGLSERQVSRLAKRVAKRGIAGLKHGNIGKPSGRKTPNVILEQITDLFLQRYKNFNYEHFHEKLKEQEGISIGLSVVKRTLAPLQLTKRPRRSRKARRYRARKISRGLLLQMDGSDHEWIRGQRWTLIAGIDDATSEVPYGEFFPTETLEGYTRVLSHTFEKVGVPRAIYVDCASWLSGTTQREESGQFKRMCRTLGIQPIYAESAQAKGRIERFWGTLQDRLVAELALHGISSMHEATKYFNDVFLPHWNARFTVKAQTKESLYQVAPSQLALREIFALHYERKIRNDETILWQNELYQSTREFGYSIAKRNAEVRLYPDGSVRAFLGGMDLELKKLRRVRDLDSEETRSSSSQTLRGLKTAFSNGYLERKAV